MKNIYIKQIEQIIDQIDYVIYMAEEEFHSQINKGLKEKYLELRETYHKQKEVFSSQQLEIIMEDFDDMADAFREWLYENTLWGMFH